jgi:hypothetical protein
MIVLAYWLRVTASMPIKNQAIRKIHGKETIDKIQDQGAAGAP